MTEKRGSSKIPYLGDCGLKKRDGLVAVRQLGAGEAVRFVTGHGISEQTARKAHIVVVTTNNPKKIHLTLGAIGGSNTTADMTAEMASWLACQLIAGATRVS